MAGAVWIATTFPGSSMAFQTSSTEYLSWRAPVGQWATHWPQLIQTISEIGLLKAEPMIVRSPFQRFARAPTPWRSWQARMQRWQRMH
jgi:hypothetical protein